MSKLVNNISANFLGQVWVAFVGIVFVPVYLRFIGVEGYGVIGFFILLTSAMAIFDGGLGAVATRESSLYEVSSSGSRLSIALTLRSIEFLFWIISVSFAVMIFFLSPLMATKWLAVELHKVPEIVYSLRLMSVALLFQFPLSFYTGCLVGLQKQVLLNKINVIFATLRSAGAALILSLVSPTLEAFFFWQCLIGIAAFIVMRKGILSHIVEWSGTDFFSLQKLLDIGSFTAGVGLTNVLAFLLIQADKIILSKVLSLKDFGCYMLAWTIGSFAFRLISPVFNAYYPRISILIAHGDSSSCYDVFLKSSRLLSSVIIPLSIWISLYSVEILFFWTGQEDVSKSAAPVLSVLALGTMFHSLLHMPYALQLAYAWTRFSVWQNSFALVFVLPLTYFLSSSYGLAGGGWPWLLVNLCFVLICVPVILSKLAIGSIRLWCIESVILPFALSIIPLIFFKLLMGFFNLQGFVVAVLSLVFAYFFVVTRLYLLATLKGAGEGWKNIL